MSNLKDLINLAKIDGGKFFVVDEEGDAKLVIMGIEEYQKMLLGKLKKQVMDVEKINKEIRSEEHTSELQSHSFISYAVFCLKKKKKQ